MESFKTTGLSTPHELRNVLDQEINNYLMAMRDEGYQLISIERVDADSIFNDINHWVATSSYRFLEYTRRQTKTFAEEQGTQSTVTESSSITPQHLDVFGSAFFRSYSGEHKEHSK